VHDAATTYAPASRLPLHADDPTSLTTTAAEFRMLECLPADQFIVITRRPVATAALPQSEEGSQSPPLAAATTPAADRREPQGRSLALSAASVATRRRRRFAR
jgi:hypothetical protein